MIVAEEYSRGKRRFINYRGRYGTSGAEKSLRPKYQSAKCPRDTGVPSRTTLPPHLSSSTSINLPVAQLSLSLSLSHSLTTCILTIKPPPSGTLILYSEFVAQAPLKALPNMRSWS